MNEAEVRTLLDNAWLGEPSNLGKKANPLKFRGQTITRDPQRFLANFFMDPDNFFFLCKHVLNVEPFPFQCVINKELFTHKYPMLVASRGLGKSFSLALYAVTQALLRQGIKIILVGSAFRQAKILFEYCQGFWDNAPVLRSMVDPSDKSQGCHSENDRIILRIGRSQIIGIPLGNGEKIRGLRGNIIIADEFSSINVEVYETVVSGFAATNANVVQRVKEIASLAKMKELGIDTSSLEDNDYGNQSIISGTAGYSLGHFCDYWKKYKAIIESKGDPIKYAQAFGKEPDSKFNYKDYCVMRLPYDILPAGYLDETHIARQKATINIGTFESEYGAVFHADSAGYYKHSLIESCVTKKPIRLPRSGDVSFYATVRGDYAFKYIYGIDPAQERDNFSIVILELHQDHRRVVYCWTTNAKRHKELLKENETDELDYFKFCARKIRSLMSIFPCEYIAMDSQGGGKTIMEALHDPKTLLSNEDLLWPVIMPDKKQDTDEFPGRHILHMINFSDSKWVSEANGGMKKDFEDKVLLFPYFDAATLALAAMEDENVIREESLEDCYYEIEELKTELTTIVHTQTGATLRDHWDTPVIKLKDGKKGRMRKDRYSALLMANMIARVLTIQSELPKTNYAPVGGLATSYPKTTPGQLYIGNSQHVKAYKAIQNYGMIVRRP